MDSRFSLHNSHLQGLEAFRAQDPHLQYLQGQPYVFIPALLHLLPTKIPGIYNLGGGRQIGKTTLCKQWMALLMEQGVQPESIAFFSGELVDDYQSLFLLIQTQLADMPENTLTFLVIDEITYIKGWDRAIKYAADAGLFRETVVLLTGSDLTMMQDARITFPGRRGTADVVDFHLYPLSFREFIELKAIPKDSNIETLYDALNDYLMHGGYLTAINDMARYGEIRLATLMIYSDWIRGDMVKRGKQEIYIREILSGIIEKYNSQVSWNAMVKNLSIDHPQTVIEYCELLEKMDALFIQYALMENKLLPAPKKAKKLFFTDPFIFHAVRSWLKPCQNPYKEQISQVLTDSSFSASLIEACVVNHFQRRYPTYYIKAEGEVDVAYVKDDTFWPVEIKWRNQLRPKDLKQILKYDNSKIFAKVNECIKIHGIEAVPLPLGLLEI